MDIIGFEDVPLKMLNGCDVRQRINNGVVFTKEDYNKEFEYYNPAKLTEEQMAVYSYHKEHPNEIILLQASSGCGRTHTMLTLAYNSDRPVYAVIYKNDLLRCYRYCTLTRTVAKFVMDLFELNYDDYILLDRQLNGRLYSYEFMAVLIALVRKANIDKLKNATIILEYTLVSKPILYVVLLLMKMYKIGVIVCGDRYQLQNFRNSDHAIISSFRIASSFATKCFELSKNFRCEDTEYNKIIQYISKYSSKKYLDEFGNAFISAIFYDKLITDITSDNIHIAATHQELADIVHALVSDKMLNVSFYFIHPVTSGSTKINGKLIDKPGDLNHGLYLPEMFMVYSERQRPLKFLPYLPLIPGMRYFYNTLSEYSQVTLSRYIKETNQVVVINDYGDEIILNRCCSDEVLLEQHKDAILGGKGMGGSVYNFPIYPAFFMTLHTYQGRKRINHKLNLFLSKTTYQGLYTAVSRVHSHAQIYRVEIENHFSYLVSTIINFPELCHLKISADNLKARLLNYTFYGIPPQTDLAQLVIEYIFSKDIKVRTEIRDKIIHATNSFPRKMIQVPDEVDEKLEMECNNDTLTVLLDIKEIIAALSSLPFVDAHHWLLLFKNKNEKMRQLQFCYDQEKLMEGGNFIRYFTDIPNLRQMEEDGVKEDIKSKAELVKNEPGNPHQHVICHLETNLVHITNEFNWQLYMDITTDKCTEESLLKLLKSTVFKLKQNNVVEVLEKRELSTPSTSGIMKRVKTEY